MHVDVTKYYLPQLQQQKKTIIVKKMEYNISLKYDRSLINMIKMAGAAFYL